MNIKINRGFLFVPDHSSLRAQRKNHYSYTASPPKGAPVTPLHDTQSGCHKSTGLRKNPPVMRETLVRFLGWEDALEESMAMTVILPGGSPCVGSRWGAPSP